MKLILVTGLPGSGKSYFAERLAEEINAVYLSSDRERRKMFSERNYTEDEKQLVYIQLLRLADEILDKGKDVIADATFYKENLRYRFRQKAIEKNAEFFIIKIEADEETIQTRMSRQRPESEADFGVYRNLEKLFEPISEKHLILCSSDDTVEKMIEDAKKYLNEQPGS
jgi:predicted kinase